MISIARVALILQDERENMNTSVTDVIFEHYCQTREYAHLTQTPEILRAEAALMKAMKNPYEGESLIFSLMESVERRLFTLGFHHGFRLMCECIAPGEENQRS